MRLLLKSLQIEGLNMIDETEILKKLSPQDSLVRELAIKNMAHVYVDMDLRFNIRIHGLEHLAAICEDYHREQLGVYGAVLTTQGAWDYLTEQSAKYNAINTPEIHDFIKAIELEALHQRDRWGAEGDAGKSDTDWFWLIGYLAGKAINKPEKALHHIITTAAACLNWHSAKTGNYTVMRPGINAISQDDAKERIITK